MTLDTSVQVPVPESGVTVRRTGNHGVYKNLKASRNSKGQSTTERVLIGRLDPKTNMLIPNQAYWKYFGESGGLEVNSVRLVGASFLVGRIMSSLGISEALDEALGARRASKARTAVIHIVARGNVFDRVEDYCQGYTLTEKPLTLQSANDLFASITHSERMDFFKEWLAKQDHDGFLAYDVASYSTRAEGVFDKRWGYDIDGGNPLAINLGVFFSEKARLPVFYVTYPGSILDKSRLADMMAYNDELGISKVAFVFGQGFCRTDNLRRMAREGLDYIIGVDQRHETARLAIEFSRSTIRKIGNLTAQGVHVISAKGVFYGASSVMHVYLDPELELRQKRRMVEELQSLESELIQLKRLSKREAKRYLAFFKITLETDGTFAFERDFDKLEAIYADRGFYCLLTNTSLDALQTLARYRRKGAFEEGLEDVKPQFKIMEKSRPDPETIDGKLFCAFIALIVVSEIEKRLGDLMGKNRWSKSHVINEMERIGVVLAANGKRMVTPVTEAQRTILQAFGLTEDDLKSYVLGK